MQSRLRWCWGEEVSMFEIAWGVRPDQRSSYGCWLDLEPLAAHEHGLSRTLRDDNMHARYLTTACHSCIYE